MKIMPLNFLLGEHLRPWQQHTVQYAMDMGFMLYSAGASLAATTCIMPPHWQYALEKSLFKRRPAPPCKALVFQSGAPEAGAVVVDVTGHAAESPVEHKGRELKPFFDGSFDAATLSAVVAAGDMPTIGWAMRQTHDSPWRIVNSAGIAVREPLAQQAAIRLCGERLQQLLARGVEKIDSLNPALLPLFTPVSKIMRVSYVRLAIRQLRQKIAVMALKVFFRLNHWEIALSKRTAIPGDAVWTRLKTPLSHFEADPFLWEQDGKAYVFFEMAVYGGGSAVIAYRCLHENGAVDAPVVALRRPYHLSYPQLFEHEGSTYMLPENRGGALEIYRAEAFPDSWTLVHSFFPGVNAADSTLYNDGQRWWLFTSIATGSVPNWDELYLFYADSPFGAWTAHPQNPVKGTAAGARMSGNIFIKDGVRIRPGQDCRGDYGKQVLFFSIDVLNPEEYRESAVPKPSSLADCAITTGKKARWHTFNQSKNFQVIDYRHLKLRKIRLIPKKRRGA